MIDNFHIITTQERAKYQKVYQKANKLAKSRVAYRKAKTAPKKKK